MDSSSLYESISNAMLSDNPDFDSFPLVFDSGLSPLPNESLSPPSSNSFEDFLSLSPWGFDSTPDSGFEETEHTGEHFSALRPSTSQTTTYRHCESHISTVTVKSIDQTAATFKKSIDQTAATSENSLQQEGETDNTLSSKHTSTNTEDIQSNGNEPQKIKKKVHRKNQPPDGDLLPPCRICGEKASGLHYGANTCEPCKGFFRRSIVKILKKKEEYVCVKDGNCPLIGLGKRSMCSYCRYQKCLKMGMSQDAIKIGRYTYEKKTKDIKEVNMIKKGCIVPTEDLVVSRRLLQEADMAQIDEKLLETLIGIQEEFCDDFKKIFLPEHVLERQLSVYKKFKLRTETFGTDNGLSWQLYEDFLNTTGMELDDRKSKIKTMAVKREGAFRSMINFAQTLPGFSDLQIDDQFALFRGSFFEYNFLCFHKRVNPELKVVSGHTKITNKGAGFPDGGAHYSDIAAIMDEKYATLLFEFAAIIQKCQLSVEEATLARGIVLTFADRCKLQEPEKVEKIQWNLMNCLKRVIKKNHVCPEKRMWQIFNALITLRSVTEYCREAYRSLRFRFKFLIFEDLPLLKNVLWKYLDSDEATCQVDVATFI